MVRVCSWCSKVFGQKKPLEDTSRTHGICDRCLEEEMARLKEAHLLRSKRSLRI